MHSFLFLCMTSRSLHDHGCPVSGGFPRSWSVSGPPVDDFADPRRSGESRGPSTGIMAA
jgi:hypothetical protein